MSMLSMFFCGRWKGSAVTHLIVFIHVFLTSEVIHKQVALDAAHQEPVFHGAGSRRYGKEVLSLDYL